MRQPTPSMLRAGTRRSFLLLSAILLVAACNRDDPTAPVPTVPAVPAVPAVPTVVGTVLTSAGYPVAGAEVGIGAATTTTGPDGRFELTNLTPGPAVVRCIATGFYDFETGIIVPAGSLTWDISLNPVEVFESGIYDLTMLFDPTTTDLEGAFTAVATLSQESPNTPQIRGTITDWRYNGASWWTGTTSLVTGSINHNREIGVGGSVGMPPAMFSMGGSILTSGDIVGTWGFDWWVSGTFTATRRQPE